MNIRFKTIKIKGFRSIDNVQLDLNNQGTVVVKGVNEYEDKATSNGSGKSSIFEAIIFALFEETSSGEKNVENRILNDGYVVTLYFEIDGVEYCVTREGKNGKSTVVLYKDNIDISARRKTDTNKLILDILGITKDIFLDSIFLSQTIGTNLASLSPTARKERLEILTSTESTINIFKEQLKEQQIYYESQCVEAQSTINKLEGNQTTLLQQTQQIQVKIEEINKQIEKRNALGNIEDIDKEIKVLEEEYKKLQENLNNKEQEITDKEKEIEEFRQTSEDDRNKKDSLNKDLENKKLEYTQLQNEFSTLTFKTDVAQKEIIRLEGEITKIQNSDKCPTCGRKYENVNEEHIQKTIKNLEDKILEQKNILNENTEAETNITKQIEDKELEGNNIKKLIESVDEKLDIFKTQVNVMEQQKKQLLDDKIMIKYSIDEQQNKINTLRDRKEQILKIEIGNKKEFELMLNDINKQLKEIEEKLKLEKDVYTTNNDYVNCVKHSLQLVTKEFRTYLLQNSLKYLNKILTQYSQKLFSNDKDIIYIEEDDTKLNINLGNATYESLSGGEKTRVNIALLLAQKNLANIIGNITCNIIILDEILGYCDAEAEANVIDLISNELDSLESIYMVSHKELPIGYDKELVIIKNVKGLSSVRKF